MEVFSCFDDLFSSQCVVADLSVFNADLYMNRNGKNIKVEMSKLRSILTSLSSTNRRAKFLLACLDFCKVNGKEQGAYEYLERLNPGKECVGIDQFVNSTLLLPTNSGLSKKYFAMFMALDINVKSPKNRQRISELQEIIGDHPTASYSDEGIRILLRKKAEQQAQQQQQTQNPVSPQQQPQQNKPQQA